MTAWKSSMELGDLIAATPALLAEVERLVEAPWVHLPRGTRVRLRKAITKVRVHLGQVKHATPGVGVVASVIAEADRLRAEVDGSNPSVNDSPSDSPKEA